MRHHLRHLPALDDFARAIEAHALHDAETEILAALDPERAHGVEKRRVRADARAARGEIVRDALVDVDLPSELLQKAGGEETAERAADDHRFLLAHLLQRIVSGTNCPQGRASWTE